MKKSMLFPIVAMSGMVFSGCHTAITPGGGRAYALFGYASVDNGNQNVKTREEGGAAISDVAKGFDRDMSPGNDTITTTKPTQGTGSTQPANDTPAVTNPTTVTNTVPSGAPFTMSQVNWIGHTHGDLTKTVLDTSTALKVIAWDASGLNYTVNPWPPTGWAKCTIINAPDEQCMAHWVMVYWEGGEFRGSMFDHCCSSGRVTFDNFRSGEGGHVGVDGQVEPQDGTKCWVTLVDVNATRYMTPVQGVWMR